MYRARAAREHKHLRPFDLGRGHYPASGSAMINKVGNGLVNIPEKHTNFPHPVLVPIDVRMQMCGIDVTIVNR